MATYAHSDVLDGGLDALAAAAIRVLLLKTYAPGDNYATVTGNAICSAVISSGDFSKSGTTTRTLTFGGKSGTASADSGVTPNLHIAFTDGSAKVLWVTDETSDAQVYTGNTVTFPSLAYSRNIINILLNYNELTYPIYFGHGGNLLKYPQESQIAYSGSMTDGENLLDLDTQKLTTGELAVMHDTTIDATTSGSGSVASQSLTTWTALVLDGSVWHGGAYVDTSPPVGETLLSTYKDAALFSVENKGNGAALAALLSALASAGIGPHQALVSSSFTSDLATIVASGYESAFVSASGVESAATLAAYGIGWVAVGAGVSGSQVNAYAAAGMKVVLWAITRRNERDLWLANPNVKGFYSNDSKYTKGTTALRTSDTFSTQNWDHGMIASDNLLTAASRGRFASPDYWGYTSNEVTYRSCLMGFLNPIANPSAFTMDFKITFGAPNAADDTYFADVFMGTTDKAYANTATSVVGYVFRFQKNGTVTIYRKANGGSPVSIATTAGSTIADDAEKIFRITVTATTVKAAQIDGAGADITAATVADTSSRPGNVHFGRSGLPIKVRDISIT